MQCCAGSGHNPGPEIIMKSTVYANIWLTLQIYNVPGRRRFLEVVRAGAVCSRDGFCCKSCPGSGILTTIKTDDLTRHSPSQWPPLLEAFLWGLLTGTLHCQIYNEL